MAIIVHFGTIIDFHLRPQIHNLTHKPVFPRLLNHKDVLLGTLQNNQLKVSDKLFYQKCKKMRNTLTRSLLLLNLQIDLVLLETPLASPRNELYRNHLSDASANTTNANTTVTTNKHSNISALLRLFCKHCTTDTTYTCPTESITTTNNNYCNTSQFATQQINFARTSKTHSSEQQQPIHYVSTINEPQDISQISDSSNSMPLSFHFSSPIPSQIAISSFNPPQ